MRARIKKNDMVLVIAGSQRGQSGKVLRVMSSSGRAIVEGLNMVKRHTKGTPQSPSGIVDKEAPLHLSNLMVLCDKCNSPTRLGKKVLESGDAVRVCRRCGEQIDR